MPRRYGLTGNQQYTAAPAVGVEGATYRDTVLDKDYTSDGTAWWPLAQEQYVQSRETNQITNGTGFYKNNTNFTGWTYSGADAPYGITGSFVSAAGVAATKVADELVVVNPAKKLRMQFWARNAGSAATGYMYCGFEPRDAYNNVITPAMYMWVVGTDTTLAVQLKPGDTTITLTDSTNWYGSAGKPAGASTYLRNIVIWGYTDPGGKTWPFHTYSRLLGPSDLWADGSLSGNVITLRAPWAGGTYAAGTQVSNATSGGSYMYMPSVSNVQPPAAWTQYADSVVGVFTPTGAASATFATGWPQATAMARIIWLVNRTSAGASEPTSTHAIAGVSFGDAQAAQADATQSLAMRLDQIPAPTAAVSLNGQKITNLADPTLVQDAATKAYVDWDGPSPTTSPSYLAPVRLVTGNHSLSGLAAIDGVTPIAGDRIGAFYQTTGSQCGVYVAAAGAWARASDANTAASMAKGVRVWCKEGTNNGGKEFTQVNTFAVLGTDTPQFRVRTGVETVGSFTYPVPLGVGNMVWDQNAEMLRGFDGFTWKALNGVQALTSTTRPANPVDKNILYETDTGNAYVYSSGWKTLGTEVTVQPGPTAPAGGPGGFDLWVDTSVPAAAQDAGLALLLNPPRAKIYAPSNSTAIPVNAWTPINSYIALNGMYTKGQGGFSFMPNGQLQVGTAGLYAITAQVYWNASAASGQGWRRGVRVHRNSSANNILEGMNIFADASAPANTAYAYNEVELAVGDTLELAGYNDNTGGLIALGNALGSYTYMTARYICAL